MSNERLVRNAALPPKRRGADEWRRAYFVLADICQKQQAETRRRIQELPEVLDVALGYSVVRRTDVLNVLDSPAHPLTRSEAPESPESVDVRTTLKRVSFDLTEGEPVTLTIEADAAHAHAPLDVERLARAMCIAAGDTPKQADKYWDREAEEAARIATEYARLSGDPSDGLPDGWSLLRVEEVESGWRAVAIKPGWSEIDPVTADGPSRQAAVQALAARLSEP